MPALHVVLAPNAFKGTLTASAAADAMRRGVLRAVPDARCVERPIADGGDGTVDAFVRAGYLPISVRVRDALGREHMTRIAHRDGHVVMELANTCGIALLGAQRSPMDATTLGLGDAIRAGLDLNPQRISIGLGGSASTDGGTGMLVALGARLLDQNGVDLPPGGRSLASIATLDHSELDPRLASCNLEVLSDVTSPLYGPQGAAFVFAPQKGASPEEVHRLDAGLQHWSDVLATTPQPVPASVVAAKSRDFAATTDAGTGAAGGTGAAAAAVLGAKIRPGIHAVAELIGLSAAVASADLVITGEGRLDDQTLAGKGCGHVIELARQRHVPVGVVCGRMDLDPTSLDALGLAGWRQTSSEADPAVALERATAALVSAAACATPDPEGRAAGG